MKQDKLQQDEIVAIVWTDIESNSGWSSPEEIEKAEACECKTVGFFHHIKKGNLVIKHSIANNKEADYTSIPVGVIKRIRLLALNDQFQVTLKKVKGETKAYVKKA